MPGSNRILSPHEAISLEEICIDPADGPKIETFSGALNILRRIMSCDEIRLYITRRYETGEVMELLDRAAIEKICFIEPILGCSISMSLDAESGEYDTPVAMLNRIRDDKFLNTVRFSRQEIASAFKDLAHRVAAPAAQPLTPVNIPYSKWAGKTPEQIYVALKDEYSPEIIAMLMGLENNNKTDCGRALAKEERDKGNEKDAGNYRKDFDKLLSRGNSKYLLTFYE